ncbi:hypothetical protein B1A74_06910 [Thioalkalivibrio halophilus]|uniref:Uncharacterized protein n=1 Tax=Thioalkalivibrio halophilus TaxID=252474 RepID=A0A1V2ZZF6_9GAMM|nr:hypothetical protein B1A74_06910 [Thioalkalivibrio halophilus]
MEKGPLAGPFFMDMTGQDENLEGSAERSGATHTRGLFCGMSGLLRASVVYSQSQVSSEEKPCPYPRIRIPRSLSIPVPARWKGPMPGT